jgi:hypothetical protein
MKMTIYSSYLYFVQCRKDLSGAWGLLREGIPARDGVLLPTARNHIFIDIDAILAAERGWRR